MRSLLRVVLTILIVVAVVEVSRADEIGKPITEGSIPVSWVIPPQNPDALPVVSVSLVDTGTTEQVMCLPGADGTTVNAPSPMLSLLGPSIILRGHSHDGPDCSGQRSDPSVDSYRVQWQIPFPPALAEVPRNYVELTG